MHMHMCPGHTKEPLRARGAPDRWGVVNNSIWLSLSRYDALGVSAASGITAVGCLIDQALAPLVSVAAVSQGLSLHRS